MISLAHLHGQYAPWGVRVDKQPNSNWPPLSSTTLNDYLAGTSAEAVYSTMDDAAAGTAGTGGTGGTGAVYATGGSALVAKWVVALSRVALPHPRSTRAFGERGKATFEPPACLSLTPH